MQKSFLLDLFLLDFSRISGKLIDNHSHLDNKHMTETTLGNLIKGQKGLVVGFKRQDLLSRLLALGVAEGMECEVLQEGWWGKDPIAVRLETFTLALRRKEAHSILVHTT